MATTDNNSNGGNGVEASIGMKRLRLRGPMAPVMFIVIVLAGVIIWNNYHFMSSMDAASRQSLQEHRQIAETMDTLSWLMSLPQDRRPELMPPPSAWKRMKWKTYEEMERELGSRPKQ